ncbi:MAG TPA: hypothetical protein PK402_06475 [Tepidisphaeraceae bacterium]|nr:hypothetical protein [Tepidisphaeraceae bacterium]
MILGGIVGSTWAGVIVFKFVTFSFTSVALSLLAITAGGFLGVVVAFWPGGWILSVPLRVIEWQNGAPFQVGEEVVVLSKRFPGRIARIYEIWEERHEVRLELGEDEKLDFSDVLSYTDICRPPAAELI